MLKKGIFYGWWMVAAISVVHFWAAGIFVYGFTAFFNPLVEEFGWSYAATSFAASFRSLESGIGAPIVGFLTDRFGARRLMVFGAVFTGVGCFLLSRIDALWSFYFTFIFLSLGMSLLVPTPGFTAVANWFSRRRSTAIGVVSAAVGAGGILIPVLSWLIATFGWRETFIIAGIGTCLICAPLSLAVRHRPEAYGYQPDGARPQERAAGSRSEASAGREGGGLGVRQALRSHTFWILASAATLSGFSVGAMQVHVMPSLISVHMSREAASAVAAGMVVIGGVGRLAFGWAGDRIIDKRYLFAAGLALQVSGAVIFAYADSIAAAIVFLVLFGPGAGGVITLRISMQGDYFGRKAFGSIQGLMQGVHCVGIILGPLIAGGLYDAQGTYQWAWLILAGITATAIPLVLSLRPAARAAVAV